MIPYFARLKYKFNDANAHYIHTKTLQQHLHIEENGAQKSPISTYIDIYMYSI